MNQVQFIPKEETLADNIRKAAKGIKDAEEGLAKAEAEEKLQMAKSMLTAQTQHQIKSAASQQVWADSTQEVFEKRVARGVAKGALAAAKGELSAAEAELRIWQTQMSMMKLEARTYGYEPGK